MANLQAPLLAVLILLAVALQGTDAGPYGANVEDSICCRSHIRYPVPVRMVKDFFWTSESCRMPGVVLKTIKDREICADPRLSWVKKILQKLSK
ncbi:PREDICTED: c-C motif chemokine 22 [Elephantulus edwardii]|uniref:c-C motif chemokine 22 n=1 Tax=Elephantulus edwardii TaxID=28737 RepID=UPI0003F05FE8|nr:PREDICTED: c-C motif chemokine 22 [Elephantulus edwardii]